MCEQAELVEEDLRDPFVVEEGGRARVGRLVSFAFAVGGDGGVDFGEGGCEVRGPGIWLRGRSGAYALRISSHLIVVECMGCGQWGLPA